MKEASWNPPTEVDGLYDPAQEKEACGVGFVVQIDGIRSNKVGQLLLFFLYYDSFLPGKIDVQILKDARTLASRLIHRGACSCDNDTGDGAGVLTAIPHSLYSSILRLLTILDRITGSWK